MRVALGILPLMPVVIWPLSSEGTTVQVNIYGMDGNDGGREGDDHEGDTQGNQGGDPNPVCVGSATCAYNPNPVDLAVGDAINFTNLGGMKHTATGPLSFSPTLKDVVQPGGGA